MRIGVDATSWFNGRGYGRYTRELLPRLIAAGPEHDWLIYVEDMNADKLDLPGVDLRRVTCSAAPSEAASSDGARSARDMLRFRKAVKTDAPDVFFCPTVYSFFPLPRKQKAVVGVHDAIAERFPERCFGNRRARLFWNMKVRWALKQADLVLTVSDFSKRDIERHLKVRGDRIRVAVEAPSDAYKAPVSEDAIASVARTAGIPEGAPWLTYVGGFNPHKNIDVLIRAHANARDASGEPLHLLLVGTRSSDTFHGELAPLDGLITELGSTQTVTWTGFVPDDDLRALHAGAAACVLPSDCEGFGLPAVEAAACGTAVIATTESPLPDLLEGGGVFVAPRNEAALTQAILTVLDPMRRAGFAEKARERAHALTWDATGARVLEILEEAAA